MNDKQGLNCRPFLSASRLILTNENKTVRRVESRFQWKILVYYSMSSKSVIVWNLFVCKVLTHLYIYIYFKQNYILYFYLLAWSILLHIYNMCFFFLNIVKSFFLRKSIRACTHITILYNICWLCPPKCFFCK